MKKCNICKSSKDMKKGLDTRYNTCYKCKPNLDIDPGDFIYSTSSKVKDDSFNELLESYEDTGETDEKMHLY